VGGAANIGGALTISGNFTINSNVGIIGKSGTGTGGNWRFVSDDGNSRWLTGLLGGSGETSYSIYDSVNSRSLLTATAAGVVQINQTTASTSTSSGALVVSGGVGVAGAINGGGLFDFAVSANSTQVYTIQNTSTGASASTRLTLVGGTSSGSIQLYGSGHSTPNILQYASPDTHKWQCNGVDRASLSSAGALTVGSSLTTGAPTGGTAAAWKLGTVASVSPTSPNRTIEVDIGGTIYYIHAKTTNN
jgi:hypothetical protein